MLRGPFSDFAGVAEQGLRTVWNMAKKNNENRRLFGIAGACEGESVLYFARARIHPIFLVLPTAILYSSPATVFESCHCFPLCSSFLLFTPPYPNPYPDPDPDPDPETGLVLDSSLSGR